MGRRLKFGREFGSGEDAAWLRPFDCAQGRLRGTEAITLYLFLAAVSDQHGLSFYSDTSTAIRLRMSEQAVVAARDELAAEDLVAYRAPLTQVLSLPERTRVQRGGLVSLGEMFRALAHPTDSAGRQP